MKHQIWTSENTFIWYLHIMVTLNTDFSTKFRSKIFLNCAGYFKTVTSFKDKRCLFLITGACEVSKSTITCAFKQLNGTTLSCWGSDHLSLCIYSKEWKFNLLLCLKIFMTFQDCCIFIWRGGGWEKEEN